MDKLLGTSIKLYYIFVTVICKDAISYGIFIFLCYQKSVLDKERVYIGWGSNDQFKAVECNDKCESEVENYLRGCSFG